MHPWKISISRTKSSCRDGFDPLRDVGHAGARPRNTIADVHHAGLAHGCVQFTKHSERCREATEELGDLLGQMPAAR